MDLSITLALPLTLLCGLACLLGLAGWLRPCTRSFVVLAEVLGFVSLIVALAAWIFRWQAAGHLPLFGTYESSLSLVVAVLAGAAVARRRAERSNGVWPVACGVSAVLLAHGLGYDPTAYALTISERSWVVDIHAVLAWAAFAALAANAGFALRCLLRRDADAKKGGNGLSFSLSLGFLLHTAMLVSGSFYKFLLFGKAWSFDPIETLGLVAWLSYGTLLHMHLFAGWDGRRLAAWCVALFVILTVSYRGIVYFPAWSTYHIFDMDLRIHLTGNQPLP